MIVKLASVVIPACKGQDPSIGDGVFPGGHWHLEGMAAERIAATGIYYYDMTNVQVMILIGDRDRDRDRGRDRERVTLSLHILLFIYYYDMTNVQVLENKSTYYGEK